MKKLVTLLAASLLFVSLSFGQIHFGAKAGLNFNKLSDVNVGALKMSWESRTGFHVGVLCQIKLPVVGLAVQPELVYVRETTNAANALASRVSLDCIQLPVNIQWGFDLIMIRPYLMVSPYISYAIGKGDTLKDIEWKNLNRFDYGVGIGAGIDIWKLQISGKYNWGFGTLSSFKSDSADFFKTANDAKMRGFHISVAYIF